MNEAVLATCTRLREAVAGLGEPSEALGEISIDCDRDALVGAATWLRDEAGFDLCADSSAIDWLGHEPDERRYCVSVQLASSTRPDRLRVRVWLPDADPRCPSLVPVWPGVNALEREMYDFFGISFDGHPKLTRIFMPDEWQGHPQRKDEPLGGVDVRYEHGQAVTPPDERAKRPTSTSGYPGRTS